MFAEAFDRAACKTVIFYGRRRAFHKKVNLGPLRALGRMAAWGFGEMIYLGRVYGGPEICGSSVDKAISGLVQLLGPQSEGRPGSLDVVVHVPGSEFKPDFEGVRSGRFSKKERMLMVQIGLPQNLVSADSVEVQLSILGALRQAVRLGRARFEKAKIPYPEEEYLRKVREIETTLVH